MESKAPTDTALLTIGSYFIRLLFLSPVIKLWTPCQEVKGNNFRLDKYFNGKDGISLAINIQLKTESYLKGENEI